MNRYQTKLFQAENLIGEQAGEFVDASGFHNLNDWIQLRVEDGYTLKSVQPVAFDATLWVLVTMELVDLDTFDNA